MRLSDFRRTLAVFWVLVLTSCIGVASGLEIGQILFGVKIWLPFIAGFLIVESGAFQALDRPRLWRNLWALLCLGMLRTRRSNLP